MYKRTLDLNKAIARKSQFLFGPRQTGKSTLIKEQLPNALLIDLLDADLQLQLTARPGRLIELCAPAIQKKQLVVIDEIQKIPQLLDQVHQMIEKDNLKFLLTGSSARRLRGDGVNLLGGRAGEIHLHPLTFSELGSDFILNNVLSYGSLPAIITSDDPIADLKDYSSLYLTQEIKNEGLVRSLPAFSRFLEVAALCNSQLINYSNIANDAQVPPNTVREYFQILRDTLIGNNLEVWRKSKKRKPTSTAKFYFFDIGVARALQGRFSPLNTRSAEFGESLESYVAHELFSYTDYKGLSPLTFWRTQSGIEVDFIFKDEIGIEVKATTNISNRHLEGLHALREEKGIKQFLLLCLEKHPRTVDGIEIWPITDFLQALWSDEL